MTTYYDILNVEPTADADDIKAAYRHLAMQFHPDRTPGANKAVQRLIEDKFKEIQEAYDTLKDTAKRAEYDAALAMLRSEDYYQPPPPPPPPPPPQKQQSCPKCHKPVPTWATSTDKFCAYCGASLRPPPPPPRQQQQQPQPPPPPPQTQNIWTKDLRWIPYIVLLLIWAVPAAILGVYSVLADSLGMTDGAAIAASSLITASPFALWICVTKAKMDWPMPALLPSIMLLLVALTIIGVSETRIRQHPLAPVKVVQQQTPQVAKTKVQTSSAQVSVTATGAGQTVAVRPSETAPSRRPPESATVDMTARLRKVKVVGHMVQGMEFWRTTRYADAEAEYRAAIRLDPLNADPHGALAPCLSDQGRNDEAVAEASEALRLAPTSETAHYGLGYALYSKGDFQGAEAELRKALSLNSNDDNAHVALGNVLSGSDCDGGIAEYREAIRLNQGNSWAHSMLGRSLGSCKGDWDAGMREIREGLRLNPNDETVHSALGDSLRAKGDLDGAITEYREALRLNPTRESIHVRIGTVLGKKGDWDGEITEQHEALRLNPNNQAAHLALCTVFGQQGDWDDLIPESREAIRLNPNNGRAHAYLGLGLEKRGDLQGALEEYRAAYTLDPKNDTFKYAYDRLVKKTGQ